MRVRHAVPAISLLCLVVAGCTTTREGEPEPVTTSEVATASSTAPDSEDDLPSHGAPKVDVPLDTTRFQQDPCLTLTAEQAQDELNLPPKGESEDIALGRGCEWFNPSTRGQVNIGFLTGNDRGLSGFYAANQQGKYPYFIELSKIDGFPAIASDVVDDRSTGNCIVVVGVTDELAVQISLQQSQENVGTRDPCEVATEVAEKALRTMKEGS